jgi:ribosomal protein S18 acetylase RimI-like enzyme
VDRPLIRPATRADVAAIAKNNVAIARETEGVTLDEELVHMGVEAVIDGDDKGQYFVAELDAAVVGQLMLTREWSDWNARWHLWIQSVYVLPAARRRGVYRALHARAVEEAKAIRAITLRLYVERDNRVAQRTYEAMGMSRARYDVFELHFGDSESAGRS